MNHVEQTMSSWHFRINVKFPPPAVGAGDAGEVCALFGLHGQAQVLYEDFDFSIQPGQIVAVVGPSGAGKSALLAQVALAAPEAIGLDLAGLARDDRPAIEAIADCPLPVADSPREPAPGQGCDCQSATGNLASPKSCSRASLGARLEILSRCGLAEAAALVTPAGRLSGGQQYRLALAAAICKALRAGEATGGRGEKSPGMLLLVDEFGSTLDSETARVLAMQMRKLTRPGGPYGHAGLAMIVSISRPEVLDCLRPDMVIVKPLGEAPRIADCQLTIADCGQATPMGNGQWAIGNPKSWPIVPGTLDDYRALARFHYLAGPPSGHKRIWVIRPPIADFGTAAPTSLAASPVGEHVEKVHGARASYLGYRHSTATTSASPSAVSPSAVSSGPNCSGPNCSGPNCSVEPLANDARVTDFGELRLRRAQSSRRAVPPGLPSVAAVLVVSPPVRNCRGRNVATGGRYAGSDAAWSVQVLNAEVECISRVVVHPIYRGCGLAVRLVRHALEHAGTPLVEALAAMGAVHPLFELAGMKAYHVGRDRHAERFLSAADVVGLSRADVAAVKKITDVVNCKFQIANCPARVAEGIGGSGAGPDANSQSAIHNPQFSSPASVLAPSQVAFLKKELDLYIRRTLPRRIWGTSQAIANACRRATVVPVYYLGHRPGCHGNAAKAAEATSYACPSYQNHKNMRESCPIVPNRSQSFPIMPNRSHSCPIVPDGG